jgi:hypothetical protein
MDSSSVSSTVEPVVSRSTGCAILAPLLLIGVQISRWYSSHLNDQKFPVNIRPEMNTCWNMGESVSGCAISGDQHSGPAVLPNRLTGEVYHRFLVNELPVHVLLHQRQYTWFLHDRAPPCFLSTVRQHLNQTFGGQWIGRRGQVNWPSRSPDLNISGFLAVGTPENVGAFGADQCLVGITATRRQCLTGVSSETRNFRQSTHLCARENWKLCWNSWEPHRASGVEITWKSSISQQALFSGRTFSGHFLLI